MKRLTSILAAIMIVGLMNAQTLAFPGAEGYGAFATGGRGGEVVHVTNLNASGTGSLADAVSKPNRIVVFDVGGVIDITGGAITLSSNLTIAGQTAPGEGITIYGGRVIMSGCSNVIMRYVRMRGSISMNRSKCTLTMDNATNVILDHCSISWGRWDNVHITSASNITWQYCIISEGIDPQRFGAITDGTSNWTISHCLWINNKSRNPKMKCAVQYYNNVVYNYTSGVVGGHSAANNYQDVINNYFIGGPNNGDTGKYFDQWTETDHLYSEGNYHDNNKDGVLNGVLVTDHSSATPMQSPNFTCPGPTFIETAEEAYYQVVEHVGASRVRDSHDRRLIEQLTSLGTKGAFIDSEADVGGIGTVQGGTPLADTDGDGMPDEWEVANGLNPNTNDAKGDIHGDGYTNIETYVNSLAQKSSYLMAPANLRAKLQDDTTVVLTWTNTDEDATGVVIEQSTDNIYFGRVDSVPSVPASYTIEGLTPRKIYYFRLKACNDRKTSLYTDPVAINDEGLRPGGGTPAGTNPFQPSADKLYRIINYATVPFNSGTTLAGTPKYLCFNTDNVLCSTETFEYDNPETLWEITAAEEEGGVYIRNKNTGTYLTPSNLDYGDRARIMAQDSPAPFYLNYTGDEKPSQANSADPLAFFRINSASGAQIRAYSFADCWLWGSGTITRADMIFTFAEVDRSITGLYLSRLRNTIQEAQTTSAGAMVGDYTLGYSADAYSRLQSALAQAEQFLNSVDAETTTQEDVNEMVSALSQAITDFKSSRIYTLAGYDDQLVYTIYTYGQYSNGSASAATTSDPRRYLTSVRNAAETGDSLVFTIGLTEADINGGKTDETTKTRASQWLLRYGADGTVYFQNRGSGSYLQVANQLSKDSVSVFPYYAKEDNGHHAFYIETSPSVTRCLMVGTPNSWNVGDYGPVTTATPADRTRLRWVVEAVETEEVALGDVNEDGKIDINDVVAVINHIAGVSFWPNADVNADDKVDINDVVAVINVMAGQEL